MDPITIGTAIAKVADLLTILKKSSKDRSVSDIIQQIQAVQQVLQTALMEEQASVIDLKREIFKIGSFNKKWK